MIGLEAKHVLGRASKWVRVLARRVSMAPAMTLEGRRRLTRPLLWLSLVVPLVLSLWWLWTRPTRVTNRFDDALDRALAPVMAQSEVQHKLSAASSTQARLLARNLAEQSVQYLSPRDLELWQATRLRAAKSSPATCAKLWKGGDQSFLGPAIVALGDDAAEQYCEMLARGFAIRLERKPPPSVSADAVAHGLDSIAAQLSPEKREAFTADVKRRDVSDARACELFLVLSAGIVELTPAQRSDFLRALAAELQAPAP
jgi:surface antigen